MSAGFLTRAFLMDFLCKESRTMAPKISDIIRILDNLAPPSLAEKWDNIGLQLGDPNRSANKIWVALDPTDQVVKAACAHGVDLLITHHPLIFKPLKNIDYRTPLGKIVDTASRHHLTIFAAHTNLDSALGGLNDILAHRIGLADLKPLDAGTACERYKMVICAPRDNEKKIYRFISQVLPEEDGRDWRSNFKSIGSLASGMMAGKSSGKKSNGNLLYEDKIRIEFDVSKKELAPAIETVIAHQSDTQLSYDIYPLISQEKRPGIGRIGCLEHDTDLKSLAQSVKKILGLKYIKFAGNTDMRIKKAAICTGSGSSLLSNFFASGAQVYISGDLRYHDARDVEAAKLGIIDIGHFSSEHFIVDELTEQLKTIFSETKLKVIVEACDLEKDPFRIL
jgi:dinuclear metal center YbgI/SA1388 family protein